MHFFENVSTCFRYCHMSSRELVACVEETKFFQMYNQLRERVLIANWYVDSEI